MRSAKASLIWGCLSRDLNKMRDTVEGLAGRGRAGQGKETARTETLRLKCA